MTKHHIFNLDEGHDVMFYYMKADNNKINFIIFDCFLRYVEMNNVDIEDLQKEHPDEFSIYLKFKEKITVHEEETHNVDILDKEEVSSDEDERPNFEERPLNELKVELQKILNKDLT